MIKCKCGMMKISDKQKCGCSKIKFDDGMRLVRKKKPKAIPKVSEKKKERIKNNGSELSFFKKIFKSKLKKKENFCIICKKEIKERDVSPACFSHILPKGKYPEYRYFVNNINLVCGIDDHNKNDEAVNNFKQDKGLLELQEIIKDGKTPDLTDYIDY